MDFRQNKTNTHTLMKLTDPEWYALRGTEALLN